MNRSKRARLCVRACVRVWVVRGRGMGGRQYRREHTLDALQTHTHTQRSRQAQRVGSGVGSASVLEERRRRRRTAGRAKDP